MQETPRVVVTQSRRPAAARFAAPKAVSEPSVELNGAHVAKG